MLPGFFWTRGSVEKSKHTEISHKLSVKKGEKCNTNISQRSAGSQELTGGQQPKPEGIFVVPLCSLNFHFLLSTSLYISQVIKICSCSVNTGAC
jgi:hypothetical protein